MSTNRPLGLAVDAARHMMNGDEVSALINATGAIHDAEVCGECPNVMAYKERVENFTNEEALEKQMILIGLVAAAARDHEVENPGELY